MCEATASDRAAWHRPGHWRRRLAREPKTAVVTSFAKCDDGDVIVGKLQLQAEDQQLKTVGCTSLILTMTSVVHL